MQVFNKIQDQQYRVIPSDQYNEAVAWLERKIKEETSKRPELVRFEHIMKQAFHAGLTSATISLVLRTAPVLELLGLPEKAICSETELENRIIDHFEGGYYATWMKIGLFAVLGSDRYERSMPHEKKGFGYLPTHG